MEDYFIELLVKVKKPKICCELKINYIKEIQWLLHLNLKQSSYEKQICLIFCSIQDLNKLVFSFLISDKPNFNINFILHNLFQKKTFRWRSFVNIGILNQIFQFQNFNINLEDRHGDTPLFVSIQIGNFKAIEFLLLNQNLNINHQNRTGDTALLWACVREHLWLIPKIVNLTNVNVNIQNEIMRFNPLLYAACYDKVEIVRELLKNKKHDLNLVDMYGENAIVLTTNQEIINMIENYRRSFSARCNL